MSALLERLGVELPVVQAGMGGGISRSELAAAVSEAGGLGTVGWLMSPAAMRRELQRVRDATSRPIAVNLLLPFSGKRHFQLAREADLLVTFWGCPQRRTAGPWLHQCGSLEEARAAHAAGADGVIAQGVEAGGHVRGTTPALELLAQVRAALPGYPVLVAGGIAEAADVRSALDAGADAAVLGTRFLMSEESRAHPTYKQRLVEAGETVLTDLFGFSWPAPHRVIWNEAARRWLGRDGRPPGWVGLLNRASAPLAKLPRPRKLADGSAQRPSVPIFSPNAPCDDGPPNLVDAGALYAGETVARIRSLRPAAEITRELASA